MSSATTPARLLITNAVVVTLDPQDTIHNRGWILIEDGSIAALGRGDAPQPDNEICPRRLDAAGKVVMPGLVNAHTHMTGTLVKGLIEDNYAGFYRLGLPVTQYLDADTSLALARLGCLEALKDGTTCVASAERHIASTAAAVEAVGLRAVLAEEITETPLLGVSAGLYQRDQRLAETGLEAGLALVEKYPPGETSRIVAAFGPHATDTCSPQLLSSLAELSQQHNAMVLSHAAQSMQEVSFVHENYGKSPIDLLAQSGIGDDRLVAGHCIFINDHDIHTLKTKRIGIGHCPLGLTKSGATPPPLAKMYSKRLRFALGTDWLRLDPWENMRAGIAVARLQGVAPADANAHTALRLATTRAAEIIGLGDLTGSLETEKRADLIMIDLDKPHLQPTHDDLIATLVWNARGSDIETVIVDGKTIVSDGIATNVDARQIIDDAAAAARDVVKRFRTAMHP